MFFSNFSVQMASSGSHGKNSFLHFCFFLTWYTTSLNLDRKCIYRYTSHISHILVGDKIVDHSDVGAASYTFSLAT